MADASLSASQQGEQQLGVSARHFSRGYFYPFLGVLFLLGFIVLLVLEAHGARSREMRFAEHNLDTLSRVLEGHARASVDKIDVALRLVVENYPEWRSQSATGISVDARLQQVLQTIPESQSLRIADQQGRFIHDASGSLSSATITDRWYFTRQRDDSAAGLVISEPIFARITHNWVITLSRRLTDREGRFMGLVQAALPGEFFTRFYEQLHPGKGGNSFISITDMEPRLLARHPDAPAALGKVLQGSLLQARLRDGQADGWYESDSTVDGVRRILAFRRVGDYPLVVALGESVDEVLQEWWRRVVVYAMSGLLLVLLMVWLLVVWQRNYRLALEEARHREQFDRLTDLPTPALLAQRFETQLERDGQGGGPQALLLLDLDHFKHINESMGHEAGDRLLQQVAQRLLHCLGAEDLLSRQGGDEFLILVGQAGSAADLAHLAESLLAAVAKPFDIKGQEFSLSASVGIGVYPEDGQDFTALMKNVDVAMYQAKAAGRAAFRFYGPEMNEQVSQRMWLESSLRKALQRNELLLHYQPQFRIKDGALVGFEALVRWQHPEEGLIPPVRFIPVAEASNLILPLGEWVLREACRQNRAWQDSGLPCVPVAVNLSAVQFRHPDLCALVTHVLQETGLDPKYLELEITESVVMQDTERVIDVLASLKQIGIKLSIDDFGTGYSSLSYLKRFPIDKIKIDQSFVRGVPTDGDDGAIVEAILLISHKLGLVGIAEGVETREQLEFLQRSGCEEVQGYLYGRPVPASEAMLILTSPGAKV